MQTCPSHMPPPLATLATMSTNRARTFCASPIPSSRASSGGTDWQSVLLQTVHERRPCLSTPAPLSESRTLCTTVTQRHFSNQALRASGHRHPTAFFRPGTHGKRSPSPNGVFRTGHSRQAVTVRPRCFRNMPDRMENYAVRPPHSVISGSLDGGMPMQAQIELQVRTTNPLINAVEQWISGEHRGTRPPHETAEKPLPKCGSMELPPVEVC